MDPLVGKIIDDTYRITGVLGKGGMGVVYKAEDTMLEKDVAIKMLKLEYSANEEFLKLFKREPKAQAKLQHPNIVNVHSFKKSEFGLFIVMEFIEGTTLADRIREKGPVPADEVQQIFKQVLSAFDYAHAKGVIHRDIKPSNVMLSTDGTVKVADFGLAKIQQPTGSTKTMGTGGTPYYMSPEQVRSLGSVDNRGDIYSIGMTLYEAVVGRLPFDDAASEFTVMQSIVEGKVPSPDALKKDLPQNLVEVIKRAIHPDPEKRFQSAGEMWKALEKCQGAPISIDDLTLVIDSPHARKARGKALLFSGVAAIVVAVGAYIIIFLPPDVEKASPGTQSMVGGNEAAGDSGRLAKPDSLLYADAAKSNNNEEGTILLPAKNLPNLASLLVSGLKDKMPQMPKVVVLPFTLRNSKSASPFSANLKSVLEEKFVDASWPVGEVRNIDPGEKNIAGALAKAAGASHVITGSYWEDGEMVVCRAEIISTQDRSRIASAERSLPLSVVRSLKLALKPANYAQAEKDEAMFAKGEVKNAALHLEVWTNRGADNVLFAEGDTMKVYVRVNKPCYLRMVYHLADRKRTVLLDNMQVDAAGINKPIELKDKFICAAPFGAEYIQALASTEAFEPLETVEEDGYAFLKQDLGQALVAMRGMKRAKPGALQTETRITLTTLGK